MHFALHSTQTCLLTSCIIPWTIWHVTTASQRKTIAKYTFKKQKTHLTTNWNETIYQGNKIHFVMLHLQKNAMKYVRLSIALSVGVGQMCANLCFSCIALENSLFCKVIRVILGVWLCLRVNHLGLTSRLWMFFFSRLTEFLWTVDNYSFRSHIQWPPCKKTLKANPKKNHCLDVIRFISLIWSF